MKFSPFIIPWTLPTVFKAPQSNLIIGLIDNTLPTITLAAQSGETYVKTRTVTVTIGDAHSGLATGTSIQYGWIPKGGSTPEGGYKTATISSYSAGAKTATFSATGSGYTGEYYLWVVPNTLKDVAGNSQTGTVKSTGTFLFDNTALQF